MSLLSKPAFRQNDLITATGALLVVGPIQLLLGQMKSLVAGLESTLVLTGAVVPALFWARRGADRPARWRAATVILATCTAQAVFAAWQWQFQPGRIYGRAVAGGSPFGSFVNHNHFAGLIEMGALLAAGMAVSEWRRARLHWRFTALAGTAMLLTLVLLASHSRGGALALAAGALVLVSGTGGSRRARLGLLVAVFLPVFGLSVAMLPEAAGRRLASALHWTEDASLAYRLDTMGATVRLAISEPLLGVGLGGFPDEVTRFKLGHGDVRVTHAESDLLEFLAEAGLLGALALAWIGRELWPRVSRQLTRSSSRSGITLGATAAVGAMLAHSLFDFNLRVPSNAIVFATLLGLATSEGSECGNGPMPPTRMLRVAGALAILLAAMSAWRCAGALEVRSAALANDPLVRLEKLDRALPRHPYLADAYYLRAGTELRLAQLARTAGVRLERATADLQACIQLRPRWSDAWADLGRARFQRGDIEGAQHALARATELDPSHIGIAIARAVLLERLFGRDRAMDELKRVEAANPGLRAAHAATLARLWLQPPSH